MPNDTVVPDENLDTVLELGRHAQDIGADWIIVHAAALFPRQRGYVLQEYYRHISEQLDIGIAIWHQPDYNYVLEPETWPPSLNWKTSSPSNTASTASDTRS